MKCNQCSATPQTTGDLEYCLTCVNDGTQREVALFDRDTLLTKVLDTKAGLASRFSPEPVVDAPIEVQEPQPQPPVDNDHVAEGATPFTAEEILANAPADAPSQVDSPVEEPPATDG